MKIKRVIEELKIKNFNVKNDNSKTVSRTFFGVVDSVESVHFQIVP